MSLDTNQNRTLLEGYSLGMVKMEAFDDPLLCTRLLGVVILITLVASFLSWHASLILKRNFYVTGH